MPIEDYKPKRGEEILITIKRRRARGLDDLDLLETEPQKSLLPTRREDEPLKRRLQKGFITFYDLGRIKDLSGNFVDINFEIATGYTTDGVLVAKTVFPALSDYQDLADQVLSVGVENLEANYFPLDLENYRYFPILIFANDNLIASSADTSDTDHFTEKGLKLTREELADAETKLFIAAIGEAMNGFQVTGTGKNKITNIYDYDAPEVSYTPRAGDKYFLMPIICDPFAEASEESPANQYKFITNWHPLPRAPFFDNSKVYYKISPRYNTWNQGQSLSFYDEVKKLAELIKDTAKNLQYTTYIWNGSIYVRSTDTPANFPPDPPFGASPGSNAHFIAAGYQTHSPPFGALLGIIKQKQDVFYVWR